MKNVREENQEETKLIQIEEREKKSIKVERTIFNFKGFFLLLFSISGLYYVCFTTTYKKFYFYLNSFIHYSLIYSLREKNFQFTER